MLVPGHLAVATFPMSVGDVVVFGVVVATILGYALGSYLRNRLRE